MFMLFNHPTHQHHRSNHQRTQHQRKCHHNDILNPSAVLVKYDIYIIFIYIWLICDIYMTYIMCIHQQCWCSKRFPGFSERKVVWLRSSLNCTSEPYHVIHISYHPLAKHTKTYHIIPHYSMHCTQYHTFVRPHTTSHHTTLYWTAPQSTPYRRQMATATLQCHQPLTPVDHHQPLTRIPMNIAGIIIKLLEPPPNDKYVQHTFFDNFLLLQHRCNYGKTNLWTIT